MKDRQDIIKAKVETLLGERGPSSEAAMRQKDADSLIERAVKRVAMTVGKSAASAAAKASAAADEARDFATRAEAALKALEEDQAEYAARVEAELEAAQAADQEIEEELESAVDDPDGAHGDMISDRPFMRGDMRGWLEVNSLMSLVEKDPASTTNAIATIPTRFALRLPVTADPITAELANFPIRRADEAISASFQFAGQNTATPVIGLVFLFYGADGVLITTILRQVTMAGVTSWAGTSFSPFAIPAGSATCRVQIRRMGSASTGNAFVTNISVIMRRSAASTILDSTVGSALLADAAVTTPKIGTNMVTLPSYSFAAANVNVPISSPVTLRQIVNSTDLDAANAPGFTLFSCDLEFTPPVGEILMNVWFSYEVTGGPLTPTISASFGSLTAFSPNGSTALVYAKASFILPVTFVTDLPATITIGATRSTGFTVQAYNRAMAHINYKR